MDAQRVVLKVLAALPTSLLRRMAGTPIVARGAALDPLMQLLWAAGRKQPHITSLTPAEARAAVESAARTMQAKVPKSVAVREDVIPGPAGDLPVRIYRPESAGDARPVTLFFHFGGFVIGSRFICDGFCGVLAERARSVVVNVEYRLAPEHPFPAGVEDAIAAYRWVLDHASDIDGDPARTAVAGDSAGGLCAAVIAQEAKRRGWQRPVCQVLIYPWLVPNSGLPSYEDFAEVYPLDAKTMAWFAELCFRSEEDKTHPWAAPLKEDDLSGLPDAIVATAGFDPLRDEGEQYATRLRDAHVPVVYRCYEHLTHSFSMMGGVSPAAQQAACEIADELGKALH